MSSRFKDLFEEAKQVQQPKKEKAQKPSKLRAIQKEIVEPKSVKPKGKRSNPNYTGAFAYIPIKIHEEVKIKLLRKKGADFSGLVEQLLIQWLADEK